MEQRYIASDRLAELTKKHKVKQLVIATKSITIERKNEIVDAALAASYQSKLRSVI